jgi:hypothetical protein
VGVDLDPSTTAWGTDGGAGVSSDYFDLRNPGGGYEIALLRNALYVMDAAMLINGSTAVVAGSAAQINFTTSAHSLQVGGEATSTFKHEVTGTTSLYDVAPSIRALINADASYGAPPVYTALAVAQNSGATAINVEVHFLVTLLGLGNTGF